MSDQQSSKASLAHEVGVLRQFADDCRAVREQHAVDRVEAEIDRLQTALRGIQSCSTCEACRGAATLALGGASTPPAAFGVTPIAKAGVEDGKFSWIEMLAPGLPDGEHDLFPVPLHPNGELRSFMQPEPPSRDIQMAMALISEVDCHLANANWDKGATARRKLHQAYALLSPTKEASPGEESAP